MLFVLYVEGQHDRKFCQKYLLLSFVDFTISFFLSCTLFVVISGSITVVLGLTIVVSGFTAAILGLTLFQEQVRNPKSITQETKAYF